MGTCVGSAKWDGCAAVASAAAERLAWSEVSSIMDVGGGDSMAEKE